MRDTGILATDSVARRVNRESFLLLGGTAALLMQIAHPLVAAGVDQHSDFRRAPLGRLLRTLNTTLAIVFSDSPRAKSAMARINRRHVGVRGLSRSGARYDALDPALLLWVQCTLVLTSLRLYELVMGRLSSDEREEYWKEAKLIAAGLGLPRKAAPRTFADLERYESEMLRTVVVPDDTSRAAARDVLRPFGWIPGPLWWPLDALTAGLLPAKLRSALGLRFHTPERLFFRASIVGVRMILPLVPRSLRLVPQARRAGSR